ncbi:MAG: hypothetical protein U0797_15595 [Gemmataceae bacterium]
MFLRSLFERLRQLDARDKVVTDPTGPGEGRKSGQYRLSLHPLSHAASVLDARGVLIDAFPFRLGQANEAHEFRRSPSATCGCWTSHRSTSRATTPRSR